MATESLCAKPVFKGGMKFIELAKDSKRFIFTPMLTPPWRKYNEARSKVPLWIIWPSKVNWSYERRQNGLYVCLRMR